MRIKAIESQVESTIAPQVRVPLGGMTGPARAIGGLGQELAQGSEDWARVDRIQKVIEARQKEINDHDSAFVIATRTGEQVSEKLDEYKRIDPSEHENIVPKGTDELNQIYENSLTSAMDKNPEVARRVNLEIERQKAHSGIELNKIKNEKWKEYHLGELEVYKQYVEDTVPTLQEKVVMPDGSVAYPRESVLGGYNQKIDDFQQKMGLITPKKAQQYKQSTRENVAVNTIKLEGQIDPLGTMERLATGQIGRDLPTDKLVSVNAFLETQLRMKNATVEKDRIAGEREVKENRETLKNSLQGMVEDGEGDQAIFHAQALRDQGYLEHGDVTWLRGEIKAYQEMQKKADLPENDAAIKQIYTMIDQGKYAQAKRMAQETDMKPGTYNAILSEIRGIQNHWDAKATTEQKYRHSQGKSTLSGSLGIIEGQILEKLEPITKEVYDLAMREFNNRSLALGGKDDPVDLANEIIPKYQDLLLNRYQMSSENYQRLLRFKTPQDLEKAFKSGSITRGEYDSQRDIAIRLNDSRNKEEEAKRMRANKATEKAKK